MKGLKKVWKIVRYTVGIGLFLILVLGGLTQTNFFRERVRTVLLSTLHTNTRGEFQFGAITGNLLTNFSVRDVQVHLQGEEILRARQVSVRYNPLHLLRNKISVRHLIIDAPQFTLRRSADDRSNIKMLLPQKQDTVPEPREPSEPWDLEIHGLEIRDGVLLVLDSSKGMHGGTEDDTFSFDHFAVLDLNARVSGDISSGVVRMKIFRLEFQLPQADVRVERIQGEVEVGGNFVSVRELVVETERSRLKLNARLDQVDVKNLDLRSLEQSPTVIELEAENIDFKELKAFLPALSFLEGSASAHLVTKGDFGRLEIQKLDLSTPRSLLHFAGIVSNLHEPERLFLSVNSYDSVIDPKEVVQLLPRFSIPDYGHLGPVRLDLQFLGTPLVFNSKLVLRSSAGVLEGDLRFDFSKPVAEYRGSVGTREVDLGRILQDGNLASRITMRATLDGRGFGLETLNSSCRIEVDTSQIYGLTIDGGRLVMEAKKRMLDLTLLLSSQKTRIDADGRIDFTHADSTTYDFEASFTSLDLSKILKDSKHVSNLSFLLKADGWGRSLEELNGELTLSMSSSVYRDRSIDRTEASLSFDQADPRRKAISVRSDIIDVDIEGQFNVRGIVGLIERDTQQLLRILERKLAPLDSVFAHSHPSQGTVFADEEDESHGWSLGETPEVYDFRFRAIIKDLEPVAVFVGNEQFDGRADLSGTIAGPSDQLTLSLEGFIDDFFYGSVRQGVFIGELNFRAAFEGLSPAMDMRDLRSSVSIGGKSLFINRTQFTDIALDLALADEQSTVSLSTVIDSVFFADLTGRATIGEEPYRFVFDSVRVGSGEYEWRSERPLIATLDNARLSLEQATFVRGSERIRFAGSLDRNGGMEFHGDLPNVDLGSLLSALQQEELALKRTLQGTAHLGFTLRGGFDSPIITVRLALDDLAYRGVSLGRMQSTATYRNRMATLDVEFLKDTSSTHAPELSVKGTLPIDLSLTKSAGPVEHQFPDLLMDLSLRARGFHLTFLDPLLADFDDIQGTVSGDIEIQGTPESPVFTGSISTESARFFFVPNRLYYTVNATLQPERENIRIVSMEIRNDVKDQPDGVVFVTGTLALEEFSISSLDLFAQGHLLILKGGREKFIQDIQGDLYASIGPKGLRYVGTFEQSHLTGTILIERANLLFPVLRQTVYTASPTSLTYVVVDDTTGAGSDTTLLASYYREDGFSGGTRNLENGTSGKTILDGISYDVQIETKGNVDIRMIFDAVTGEELYAVLKGKLALVKDGPQTQLIGEVAVGERSHYTFYKKFDATGKLRFTGHPENPELDIKAQYRGRYEGRTVERPEKVDTLTALVELTITGTRYEPKLKVDLVVSDRDGNLVTPINLSDPQADAISYILVGKFKNDLTSADRSSVYGQVGSSIRTSLVTGFASTLLSEVITDFFRNEFGFIRTVELTYRGGRTIVESADIRLSGEIFSAFWQFGGRIFTDPTNANVSVQLSMGNVFNSSRLRNLMLELERRVRDIQSTTQVKDTYGARLYYRITF